MTADWVENTSASRPQFTLWFNGQSYATVSECMDLHTMLAYCEATFPAGHGRSRSLALQSKNIDDAKKEALEMVKSALRKTLAALEGMP